jgi:hypothetical protein
LREKKLSSELHGHINFTTPEAERERLVEEGEELYREFLISREWGDILSFIYQHLPQKPDTSAGLISPSHFRIR